MRFSVWVPDAKAVDLEVGEARVSMVAGDRGWFAADVPGAGFDIDYGFSIDGGPVRPDPRSQCQPSGVEGLSRSVDHSSFSWTDDRWTGSPLSAAVLYELHIGTFTEAGTFEGVIERLDHLVALGVTAIELLPVAEFPGRWGWGYDGVCLFAPNEQYGGPDGLKRLVDACHARGLGVVLDVVYNHLGPVGNYLTEFGPYFTDRYGTPWGAAVNLDGPGSDEVRRFFIDNALMWLREYHVDGLRLDAVHEMYDLSAMHFLEELALAVSSLGAELGRQLWVIGESDLNDPKLIRAREAGGYGLDAVWSDDFHHALHVTFTGERNGFLADYHAEDLATALREGFVYRGQYSPSRRRRFGRPMEGVPLNRLVGYAQNHDQVGNRPAGERLCHLVPPNAARAAAATVLTSPFVPMLFMGEEWGASTPFQYFTDHDDPQLAKAVSEGRLSEYETWGWAVEATTAPDPQDPETFERSKLRWDELASSDHAETLQWYRRLIADRRPNVRSGER